jgi:hypothetical protein
LDAARAVAAAVATAARLDLAVDDAVVLHDSDKLTVRLLPCEVSARIAHVGREVAQLEIDVARRLAAAGSPVVTLDPRVEPRPYEQDEFVITFWTYHESVTPHHAAMDYATALARLHAGMRALDVAMPHFTDRVAEAQELVADPDRTPALDDADRQLLRDVLRSQRRVIVDSGAVEQPLHGEPHPGNLLGTKDGLRFIDFETCCRGPVEFDIAHTPDDVVACYRGADRRLVDECRHLVLAMVAAWRWDARDKFPNGTRAGRLFLGALRGGSPWPSIDAVMRAAGL